MELSLRAALGALDELVEQAFDGKRGSIGEKLGKAHCGVVFFGAVPGQREVEQLPAP